MLGNVVFLQYGKFHGILYNLNAEHASLNLQISKFDKMFDLYYINIIIEKFLISNFESSVQSQNGDLVFGDYQSEEIKRLNKISLLCLIL